MLDPMLIEPSWTRHAVWAYCEIRRPGSSAQIKAVEQQQKTVRDRRVRARLDFAPCLAPTSLCKPTLCPPKPSTLAMRGIRKGLGAQLHRRQLAPNRCRDSAIHARIPRIIRVMRNFSPLYIPYW